ncbi:MAG: UDP-N-acetylmuramate dehydrogenase [Myxococcota bacterium]|jgi:UDP-N-acetylmuramate dehydrogenase|nr:UDP-N-acetylmuramate dehydrogenase [Myxococcota bacterium]
MLTPEARDALRDQLGDDVRFDVAMSRYTSLRIGGNADAAATPRSAQQVEGLLRTCHQHRVPHTVLGNGFNTLVLDGGIEGVVILTHRMRRLEERPGGCIHAEAGVSHASLMGLCQREGLAGLEYGAGIPGTIGGWVVMNAGIGTREAKDVVKRVEVVSPTGRKRKHIEGEALRFRYRALRGLAPGSVIVSALLSVEPSEPEQVKREIKRMLAQRSGSQPLDVPSCGSVFMNPPGDYAGRLIEEAGLKGHRHGGAEISTVHANFIANRGGARACDVLALIREAQRVVKERSGIALHTEVRILGREAA